MTTIWKLKNIAPITKMSIESTVATASLTAAITTAITTATKVIAGPAALVASPAALVASPAAIAGLFIAAIYFAAAAYVSYQQMHKNEEISKLKKDIKDIEDLPYRDELNKKADKSELDSKLNADALEEDKVKKLLPSFLGDSGVIGLLDDKCVAKS